MVTDPGVFILRRHSVALLLYLLEHRRSTISQIQEHVVRNYDSATELCMAGVSEGLMITYPERRSNRLVQIYDLTAAGLRTSMLLKMASESAARCGDCSFDAATEEVVRILSERYSALDLHPPEDQRDDRGRRCVQFYLYGQNRTNLTFTELLYRDGMDPHAEKFLERDHSVPFLIHLLENRRCLISSIQKSVISNYGTAKGLCNHAEASGLVVSFSTRVNGKLVEVYDLTPKGIDTAAMLKIVSMMVDLPADRELDVDTASIVDTVRAMLGDSLDLTPPEMPDRGKRAPRGG